MKVGNKALLLVALPLAVECAIGVAMTLQFDRAIDRESKAKSIIADANKIQELIYKTATSIVISRSMKSLSLHDAYMSQVQAIADLSIQMEKATAGYAELAPLAHEAAERTRVVLARLHEFDLAAEWQNGALTISSYLDDRDFWRALIEDMDVAFKKQQQVIDIERARNPMGSQNTVREHVRAGIIVALLANALIALVLVIGFRQTTTVRLQKLMAQISSYKIGTALPDLEMTGDDELVEIARRFGEVTSSLNAANARQLELTAEKEEFLAMVNHDLRAPLLSADGYLSLIASGEYGAVSAQARDVVETVRGSLSQLKRLTDDLLLLQSLETGSLALSLGAVSVSDVLDRVFSTLGGLAISKNVDLLNDVSEFMVRADRDRLEQVFVNLLANAIANSDGREPVKVSSRSCDGGGVQICFSNSGIVMTPEHVANLLRSPAARTAPGGGLGLSICRSIVERLGGSITYATSDPSVNVFTVSIPRA